MSTNIIQPSFSAGELSPTLYGRVDLAKYRVGAAVMRNFFVDYRGGASNRVGTKFVDFAYTNDTTRLIPFRFSTLQNYILEFGQFYMRVIKDGGYVLNSAQTITALTAATPGVFTIASHGYSDGDWVYLTCNISELNGKTGVVRNVTTNTFTLEDNFGNPINTNTYAAFSSGTASSYYKLVTPWAAADLAILKFTQSADTITFTHPLYPAYDMTRTDHNAWSVTAISFAASIAAPANVAVAASTGTGASVSYKVTSVAADGDESLPSTRASATNVVNVTTTSGTSTVTWDNVTNANYFNVYRTLVINGTAAPPVGSDYGFVGVAYGVSFKDSNIVPDFTKTPPLHYDPFATGAITVITMSAGGSGYTSEPAVSITDGGGTGTGFVGRAVISGGAVVRVIIDNGGSLYQSPTVVFTGGGGSSAAATATVGPASGTYPSVVTYFQQRKVFAASLNYPQTIWATKPGQFDNMDYSIPSIASDSLNLTLASQQVNSIKHMITMPGGLVVLTAGGAWQVSGGGNNAPITPSTATATPQAYNGCSDLPPIVVNYDILYSQVLGSSVRDLSYNFFTNIYTGVDVSILSNHLLAQHPIVEWTWAEEPYKVVWGVREDGALLSLTYIKEQEVYGWARHDTQGLFKSIASIPEGDEIGVYFVVSRYVQGAWRNYVERFATRITTVRDDLIDDEEIWFSDCALDYPLTYPAATLQASAATGTITLTADTAVFDSGNVGDVIRLGGGIMTVTAYIDTQTVTALVAQDIIAVIPDNDSMLPLPAAEGTWSIATPVTTVRGLDHLEGMTVKIVGDGSVLPDQMVTGGAVFLPEPCTRIIVGLGYTCQLQTLPLDTGEPTSQGKRKAIKAVTLKVANTRGLKMGPTFDSLVEFKAEYPYYGVAPALTNGMIRLVMTPYYSVEGQICIQQDDPLPATVLATIPEIILGDNYM